VTFLPIVERELRVAARKKGTHWLWFFAGLTAMVVVFIVLLGSQRSASPQSLGTWVFNIVSGMAFAFSLLAGVFLTSDCLCSEKREGTLALLFLTDLKGYDIVLGKLVATSIVSVYALLAIIPMLGLPLIMGGVSPAEFGRMTLVLLVTLFLSLAAGMFASAISRDTRAAMMSSFSVMLGVTGVLFGTGCLLFHIFRWKTIEYLILPSPIGAFMLSHDSEYLLTWHAVEFWISIGLICALALAQLVAASLLLPRAWQAGGIEVERKGGANRLHLATGDQNPFRWLVERDAFLRLPARIILSLLFLGWGGLFVSIFFVSSGNKDRMGMAFYAGFGLHVIGKGLLAVQATRRFSEDRRSGALELLLTTPMEVSTILDGQMGPLKRQFRWLRIALLGVNTGLVFSVVFVFGWDEWEPVVLFTTFCVGGSVLWLMDTHALMWLGMWMGLRGLRHHRATLNTLGRILAPPWIAFVLFILLTYGTSSGMKVLMLWSLWFVFSVVSALLAVKHRKSELLHDFRRLAAGDKQRTAFDALQPWLPGWKSDEAASAPPAA
jgi:ABC-type transport system involved in cytochrome c biogenesis permease component